MTSCRIIHDDVLRGLAQIQSGTVQCVVTSPPYWKLRDYETGTWRGGRRSCTHRGNNPMRDTSHGKFLGTRGSQAGKAARARPMLGVCTRCGARRVDEQIGLERTPAEYVARLVQVFREVRRVLRPDGVVWLNMGDSYAGARRGGNPGGVGSSTLQGGREHQEQARRAGMTTSRRRDRVPVPRSDCAVEGIKPKDMVGMPWRLAFALQADGWWLRSDVIWEKPTCVPEPVKDRPTKSHEYVFLLSRSARYFYDAESISEPVTGNAHSRGGGVNPKALHAPHSWDIGAGRHETLRHARGRKGERRRAGQPRTNASWSRSVRGTVERRNLRSVWRISSVPFKGAHFATFPPEFARRCILAASRRGDLVMDPFGGTAVTGAVATALGRRAVVIELGAPYVAMARSRLVAVPQTKEVLA